MAPLKKANPDNLLVSDGGVLFYKTGANSNIECLAAAATDAQNVIMGRNVVSDTSATHTLTYSNSGKFYIAAKTSSTQTYTLPLTTDAPGAFYTFFANDAGGEINIVPVTPDTIMIKATVDQGASVVTAAAGAIKNTAASNVVGDSITLISDGVSQWKVLQQSGIWAAV